VEVDQRRAAQRRRLGRAVDQAARAARGEVGLGELGRRLLARRPERPSKRHRVSLAALARRVVTASRARSSGRGEADGKAERCTRPLRSGVRRARRELERSPRVGRRARAAHIKAHVRRGCVRVPDQAAEEPAGCGRRDEREQAREAGFVGSGRAGSGHHACVTDV
jgi:hypothetical protein